MAAPRPTLLLLSEDAGKDAPATLAALVRPLLRRLCATYQEDRVLFQPLNDTAAERSVHGNRWKSRAPRDRQDRLALMRTVATHLLQDDSSFVLFHVDGDRRFSERETSENRAAFAAFVDELARDAPTGRRSRDELARALRERLLLMMPFYSIESWVYQNTEHAVALCRSHHQGRDIDRFQTWAADRASLDEELRPKESVCLRDRHNRSLAEQQYPTAAVLAAQTSLAAALAQLAACTPLHAALEATQRWC